MSDNNVDDALTPEPKRDPWVDSDEQTEDAGKVSSVLKGRTPDAYFAAAHDVGAALREQRRQQRAEPPEEERPGPSGSPARVALCSVCGRYVTAEGSHHCKAGDGWSVGHADRIATEDDEFEAKVQTIDDRGKSAYAHYEQELKRITRGGRNRADIQPEWREPPGYPGYLLHSVTRELWSQAREITLPDGRTRRYTGKLQTAHNGSHSLSVNGVKSSRGINALWSETFPEYDKKPKMTGEWAGEPHRGELDGGLAEWLGEGGAHITTRPT